jgi:hypothetical protein
MLLIALDPILRLIDRVIDLAKRGETVNRALFVDFVQPAFQSFESVHEDYIDSLTRYSARLADPKFPMDLNHPVFGDIQLDSLKSEHLRSRLRDFRPDAAPPKLREFLRAIDFYLKGMAASGAHAAVVEKLAQAPSDVLSETVGSLVAEKNVNERGLYISPQGPVIFSDPMREALRNMLVGFDARQDVGEEEDHEMLSEGVLRLPLDENERRRMCAAAVRLAMEHFQACYSVVSSALAKLRSELLAAA